MQLRSAGREPLSLAWAPTLASESLCKADRRGARVSEPRPVGEGVSGFSLMPYIRTSTNLSSAVASCRNEILCTRLLTNRNELSRLGALKYLLCITYIPYINPSQKWCRSYLKLNKPILQNPRLVLRVDAPVVGRRLRVMVNLLTIAASCPLNEIGSAVWGLSKKETMTSNDSNELAELITLEQAAERLTVCRRTLEREIARGRFPKPVRIGRATRVAVSDLRAYIESLKSGVIAYPVQ